MCVCKRRLPNPGYIKSDPLSSPYIEVNCQHCWQCILERSNNFTFRVVWEVLHSKCLPFYSTLTYSPKFLPILHYLKTPEDDTLSKISVWNRQHVQRFHKVLRRQLQYYFNIDSSAFKYLVTCERGSDRQYVDWCGRMRIAQELPHYHCLHMLNVDPDLQPVRDLPRSFYRWCKKTVSAPSVSTFFRFLLTTRWFYGHVDDVMYCRDVAAASAYITKYITKNISEPVFSIEPSSIFKYRDFDDYLRNIRVRRTPKKDGTFKKIPPVSLTDLCPRSFSSINLGLGFLFDKSLDELSSYFLGFKKVTLPFSHSSALINLPGYYYNKICRSVSRLHYNRFYSVRTVSDGLGKEVCKFTRESFIKQPMWDNIHGFFIRYNKRVYTSSSLSDFGKRVKRLRSFYSIKRLRDNVVQTLSHREYTEYLVNEFNSLSRDVISNVKRVTHSLNDLFSFDRSFLFPSLIKYRSSLCPDKVLDNVVTLSRLCQFTSTHLRHVAFESVYRNKLGRVATDNPDLFLTHYV